MSAFLRNKFLTNGLNRHHYRTTKSNCKQHFLTTNKTITTTTTTNNNNIYRILCYSNNKSFIFILPSQSISSLSPLITTPFISNRKFYCDHHHHHLPNNNFGALSVNHRYLSTSSVHYEQTSSKVEATVNTIKQNQKDKEKEELKLQEKLNNSSTSTTTTVVATQPVAKKTLKQRIWAELVHYYHGFRLLFIDINVCRKLLWRILNGKTLTRRENRLLVRTTSDLFRLLPFSVFIIVPFMELLLPLAIKLFPGMLPSTFQTANELEDKVKQNFKVKLEMAKFLQKTLDDMSLQHKDHRSQAAKDFSEFCGKVRGADDLASHDEIIKFSKLFDDEITLDSLNRQQLSALCRVLEANTIGTSNFLRFQLRMKIRSLIADDKTIQKEGIDSLNLSELQAACRARGMRAYGMPEERLKQQLQEWIDMSLNEKVSPSLLLLSRALMLPENVPTTDKLKATISALPETIVTQTKAAIGEREGKIDNKTKIEVIKEEERKIKEEREEEKQKQKEKEEILVDKAPTIAEGETIILPQPEIPIVMSTASAEPPAATSAQPEAEPEISSKDMEVLGDALGTLSKEKKKLIVEKEEIKDLKEEIADYQEDVKELNEVVTSQVEQVQIKESRAAKLLFKKVNSMINKLDTVLENLEKKEKQLKQDFVEIPAENVDKEKKEELVRIDELMLAIKQIKKVPTDSRLEKIHTILGKIDDDQDGHIKVEDVLKVIETIATENVQLNSKQLNELIDLFDKEEAIEAEVSIEKALTKSLEAKESMKELSESTTDSAKIIDASNTVTIDEPIINADELQEAAEKSKENILPSIKSSSKTTSPSSPGSSNNSTKSKTL
uniref:Mitochondrial proton/calcium exchanger protein n=1 Tax=Corethrella appendiculata TaxID=1370023 RepID=U5EUZ5_9DIPT